MKCHQIKSVLADYLDDDAADDVCQEIERHLKECGPCEIEIDALKKTILIYRAEHRSKKELSASAKQRLFVALSYEYRQSSG